MTYWERPLDITANWAELREKFSAQASGHGGEFVHIGVVVDEGSVTEVLDPEYRKAEPRLNGRVPAGRQWWAVIRRLRSVCGNGRCIVTTAVLVDSGGNPVRWAEPTVRGVE